MVHHEDPEPNGVGGQHVGVKVLDEDIVGLHQVVQPQHGVLQQHGVQGHHSEPHVPLGHGLRPNGHAMTSSDLIDVQQG